MVTIKVKTSDGKVVTLNGSTSKPISIQMRGSNSRSMNLKVNQKTSTALLSLLGIPKSDWYELWLAAKKKAMKERGSDSSGAYNFEYGLRSTYVTNDRGIPYIKEIGGASPIADGQLFILGDKYISLFPRGGELTLGAIKIDNRLCKWLTEIHYFIWRLYHAYNYLMTRLVYFDDDRCGMTNNCENRGALGNCLGTLLEYQAQVAIYNHLVWRSSYQLSVDTVVEKVAVGIGYTAQDCDVAGVMMTVEFTPKEGYEGDAAESLNSLTIFRSGKSTNAGATSVNTSDITPTALGMWKVRHAGGATQVKSIYGTGYESDYATTGDVNSNDYLGVPGPWETIRIAFVLGPMARRQRYYEVFSLAVATGVVKTLQLPENINEAFKFDINVSTSWTVLPTSEATQKCTAAVNFGDWSSIISLMQTYDAVTRGAIKVEPLAVNVLAVEQPDEGEES